MVPIIIVIVSFLVVSISIEAQTITDSNYPAEIAEALELDLFTKINTDYENLKASKNLRRNEEQPLKLSNTGFVYQNIYVGSSTCATPSSMYGEAVNHCHTNGGYSYKFQLVDDNCKGAFVEYFADQACSNLLGTAPLDSYEGSCQPSSLEHLFPDQIDFPVYQSLKCTTATAPVIPEELFVYPACQGLQDIYQGDNMGAVTYSASAGYFSTGDCTTSTSLTFYFALKDKNNEIYDISAQCYNDNNTNADDLSYQYFYADDDVYNPVIEFDDFEVSMPSLSEESNSKEQAVTDVEMERNVKVDDSELTNHLQTSLVQERRRLQQQGEVLKVDTYHFGLCPALDWNLGEEEETLGSGRRLTVQPWVSVTLPSTTSASTDHPYSQLPGQGSWEWQHVPSGLSPVLYLFSAIIVVASAAVVVASWLFARKVSYPTKLEVV